MFNAKINNMINITAESGIIDVYDALTNELLFVMGSENMLNRANAVNNDHQNRVIKAYKTGWSEHRARVAKDATELLFVGRAMPEKVAKDLARTLDKFSKSKKI